MPLINISQINSDQFALAVQQYASGASFSGNLTAYLAASGWIGPLAVTVTGVQVITGLKTFQDSPRVPYYTDTGSVPSARWVSDQISAASTSLLAVDAATSGYALAISGQLSAVRATGSSIIASPNFSGLGGTLVIRSGSFVLISGAGGGGGGGAGNSNVSVTGSSTISAPNFTGAGSVVLTYDGTYVRVSGAAGADATLSGYVEGNFVNRLTDQDVTGTKTFVSSPLVPAPTVPSGATNLLFVSGVSGVLTSLAGSTTNTYNITGTGVVATSSTGNVTNTFNITSGSATVSSSGTVNNTFNGAVINTTSIGTVTGNFVNMGVFFDEFSLATGLNLWEGFVGRSFTFTGYGLGAINTGTQGFLSGSFYQRTATNTKTRFVDFYLNSGTFWYASGGFNQDISGLNRVGLDIYRIGTGLTGVSIGLFGVGY